MALSQVQCLDNNNVNWRSSESKPEFFYSEEQRLALEALVSNGADAFYEVLKKENIRDFLSDLEIKKILERVEPFDPGWSSPTVDEGNTGQGGDEEEDEEESSLQYWPQRSDHSIPELDMGWPETVAYRGVTRATVYMQPPMEGQAHIKEVVRKMITAAQKVIAVVMDMFTDVDILKDMLDAGFKRRISIYIILDESNVKYFLQMCQRAQMHEGHLKNLRVQCIGGTEFLTRFSTKFSGAMAQKFIFVDGDKAACGSYSFTWSAARTDRNVLTVLTGQVVETFDKQFQELYLLSKAVSLKSVGIAPEPVPEPVAEPTAMPADTTATKKIVNPKYALVKAKDPVQVGAASSGKQSGSKEGTNRPESNRKLKSKAREQPEIKEPFVHPALQNMEKVNMFNYLPTWVEPEPEPGNEVLGYINIIDPNIKNAQLSQMNRIKICDTSHATAQHMMMMQNRDQEAKQRELQRVPQVIEKAEVVPKPTTEADVPQKPVKEDCAVDSVPRQKAVHQPIKMEVAPSPVDGQEPAERVQSPEVKTPERLAGAFAFLAGSQHLVSTERGEEQRHDAEKGPPPPVPKPRTVPVKDVINKNNALGDGPTKVRGEQTETSDSRAGGTPNGTHQPIHEAREGNNELDKSATQNGLVDDEDDEEYVSLSDQGSSSDGSIHANHCPSNTSSNSDYSGLHDYHRAAIQRSHSELIPNGEPVHIHRQMSDSHISRGTFVNPLKDAQSMLDENGRRRNRALEEEIRRALERSRKLNAPPQRNDRIHTNDARIHTNDADQGKSFFQYRSRPPGSTPNADREGFHGHQQETQQRLRKFRMEAANETDGYRQAGNTTSHRGLGHARTGSPLQRHSAGPTLRNPSPFPEHQGGQEAVNTPFGIPYSKLSESKHLKSRLGGHGDFKRRGHKDQ